MTRIVDVDSISSGGLNSLMNFIIFPENLHHHHILGQSTFLDKVATPVRRTVKLLR